MEDKVDLAAALSRFDEAFQPRIADEEAHVLLIEPLGTPNTGDSSEREPAPERAL
jgi:hypothetical protein